MKFNKKCVNYMCGCSLLLIILLLISSCNKPSSEVMMTEVYPELYQAIYERDAETILSFTDHKWEAVRKQAWRALINSPVQDKEEFIELVKQSNKDEAWAALSSKNLTDQQLQQLMNSWERSISLRAGISRVLGWAGNEAALRFLTRNFDQIVFEGYEEDAALALGRLMGKYDISNINEDIILRHAAIQENEKVVRGYFYGHYRSGKVLQSERTQDIVWETFLYSDDPLIKQYMLKIAFQSDRQGSFRKLDISNLENMHVQTAVELINFLGDLEWSEKLSQAFKKLLEHSNPVVNEVAFNQLKNYPNKPDDFDEFIISQIINNREKDDSVRLSGIAALNNRQNFLELAYSLSRENEYLLIKKLEIFKEELTADQFLTEIERLSTRENRMEVLFAIQSLGEWWNSLPQGQKNSENVERVRAVIFDVIEQEDRSVTYTAVNLLNNDELIKDEDFERLKATLSRFELPEDIEVFQVVTGLLSQRFKEQSKPIIQTLTAEGNSALNQTLKDQGWEISDTESKPVIFREPNWNRLLELGFNPIWVLQTTKGNIKVEMDVLSAPATISAIDSLTSAGAYNDVAFHRVVPNFVIQGGDVETGDGFGGPDFVIPTEASAKQFRRGMAGIASAGIDTEGSQYFFMHQWAPHLNGRYTIFGEVIEGMEVVDRILVGDKVESAYWQ